MEISFWIGFISFQIYTLIVMMIRNQYTKFNKSVCVFYENNPHWQLKQA